ncbi:MAG: DUF6048 family protein [Prevotella sp.]|jgi:hypothetical protein
MRISKYILRKISLALLLLLPLSLSAQQRKQIVVQDSDSIATFRGVAVSVDLVGPIQLLVSSYGQLEAALRVNLKDRYFPIVEIGYGKADADDDVTRLQYKTSAPYGRIGMDFNLLRNKHDDYRLYAGFRYAYTSYKFDVDSPNLIDPVWGGDAPYSVHDIKANCGWAEAVFSIDAKIFGPIRMGWSVRYKHRLHHDDGTIGNTWYVPGYGKQGNSRLGGTFNITFEI